MQTRFHLYVRQHLNGWYTVSVLTHPAYATSGRSFQELRDELRSVLADEIAEGRLGHELPFYENMTRRVIEVELRAVQQERLINVPMRFTVLHWPIATPTPSGRDRERDRERDRDREKEREKEKNNEIHEVWIPRLREMFRIRGVDNIEPWAAEVIRGFFHLKPVSVLLGYDYERGERIEQLDVQVNPKKAEEARREREKQRSRERATPQMTALGSVGVELVQEAREGRLPRALFRDAELRQLVGILEGANTRSVLLTGPSGVGKTALVHELAHRVAAGSVSPRLLEVPVWHVSGGRIIAGMKYLGEWQERCLRIVREIRDERGVLYADNVLELLMAGSARTGQNVAQFLLPWIQSGEIAVIAESTPDALTVAEQLGGAFLHAFRRLPVRSFGTDEAYKILEITASRLEKQHKVQFTAEALSRGLDVLARFGATDSLPGSGLALIEQMARVPATSSGADPGRQRDRHNRVVLAPRDAITAFSRASGFPENLIDPDQLLDVPSVGRFFTERIIGQDEATRLLTHLVMVIKSSLNDPERPLGSFLFMGPTGVGKTESALTLAEYLFSDRKRLLRFDMSEYGYPGSAARLVGGSRGEGDLTRKVREQPFSVILLDEVEKADSEVFDILLQVLGEGRLTDGTGRTVRFNHTIIIMTSNLGAGRDRTIGLNRRADAEGVNAHYREAARAYFRPEFLNRIDYLVPFRDLAEDDVRQIARMMLDGALKREGFARRQITVGWQPEVLELLMAHGFDPRYGARPMKRAVEQHVLVPLSRRLVLHADLTNVRFDLYTHEGHVAVASDAPTESAPASRLADAPAAHPHLVLATLGRLRLRLQRWDEHPDVRALRQRGALEIPGAILRLQGQLSAYTDQVASRRAASRDLDADDHARFAAAFDADLLALEWALVSVAAPPGDAIALRVTAADPRLLDALNDLTEAWTAWVQARGGFARATRHGLDLTFHAEGPGVGALRHEVGRHRLTLDDQPWELTVLEGDQDEPPAETPLVREYNPEPPSAWDPTTEIEVHGPLRELHRHLDRLLLARMSLRGGR